MYYYAKDKYWIFKLNTSRREFIINSIIKDTHQVDFTYEVKTNQDKELYGHVLFLYQNDYTNDYVFEFEATINSSELINTEDVSYFFKIFFDDLKRIKTPVSVEDVKYSFKNITNLKTPIREFNLNLNSISKVEFEAVLYGDIFFSRTIFIKLYESLPYQHKLAFYKIIFDLNPFDVELTNDHELLLTKIEDYIETYILKPAKLFAESSDILKKLVDNEFHEKIGFNTKDMPVDYIEDHLDYAGNFISLYNKDLFDKFKQTYENFKETESEFKKVFKSIPSPVTLR